MRRVLAGLVTALAAAAALAAAGTGGDGGTQRVAAVFDDAGFLIPGQDVKIAGARVGTVEEIHLTPDRKARVDMEIGAGFAPFRADARCSIRPASLIGEKFIQCDPGSPEGKPLAAGPDGTPTVPLERTSSPVDLDMVFATLRLPYRQRLAILVNELGAGLAGRPKELNAAIRRANPALREANELLVLLDRDRAVLSRLVDRSDRVLRELAAKERETASFIERADAATRSAAARSDELETAIRRLPPLLGELEPSAESLARLARDGRPVVRDLRAAAPAVRTLLSGLDPLAEAARPALAELAELSRTGRRAVRASRPVAERLRPLARRLPPLVDLGSDLLESVRDSGATQNVALYGFYGALAASRFDRISHILPSYQISGGCQAYATEPVEGCSARFGDARGARQSGKARDAALDFLMGP